MKIAYKQDIRMSKANKLKLAQIIAIVEDYAAQGYVLTLRQLYYQMVSRGHIPNGQNEYVKIGEIAKRARMAGLVDWEFIEDRTRKPRMGYAVDDVEDALNDTVNGYKLDRQKGQDFYIELWVEKDAISNVLWPKVSYYHNVLMVNRGYSSVTAMHDASLRFRSAIDRGQTPVVLYLGDHDPSGMDMLRDIEDRMADFGLDIVPKHIGITMKQIKELDPPPFPAKLTDPRVKDYVAKYGDSSWEVDALPPDYLQNLVVEELEALIDMDKFEAQLEQERIDKAELDVLLSIKSEFLSLEELYNSDQYNDIIESASLVEGKLQKELKKPESKQDGVAQLKLLNELDKFKSKANELLTARLSLAFDRVAEARIKAEEHHGK